MSDPNEIGDPHDAADLVRRIDAGAVAVIELNRPDRRNALTGPMFDRLADHLAAVDADDAIAAVAFCGAGGAFCSGLDLDEYRADPPPEWLGTASSSVLAAHQALARCRVPVVVALERYAINAGASLALAADLMVAGESAWLQVMEAPMGMAAPMNLAWLLAKWPPATARRIVLTAERFPAGELTAMQIAHEVVADTDVRSRTIELAATIAAYPAGAGAQMKAAIARIATAEVDDLGGYLADASELGRWGP